MEDDDLVRVVEAIGVKVIRLLAAGLLGLVALGFSVGFWAADMQRLAEGNAETLRYQGVAIRSIETTIAKGVLDEAKERLDKHEIRIRKLEIAKH